MLYAIGGAVLGVLLLVLLVVRRINRKKAGIPVFHLLKDKPGGSHWYIVLIFLTAFLIKCGSNPAPQPQPQPQPIPVPTPTPIPQPTFAHERGFIKQPGQGLHVGAPFILADRVAELPVRFSWASTYDLPVENQGGCGSCWSFSTVENMEWAAALFLDKKLKLSEQFMVSQMFNGCGGGDFGGSLEIDPGLPLESDCPYRASNRSCQSGIPIALKAVSMANIGTNGQSPTLQQLKEAMLEYGPLSVDAAAGGDWDGLAKGDVINGNSGGINHMVIIYGWDDSVSGGVWLMRNSWGASWADNGSALITYGADSIASDAATVLVKPLKSYKQWPR